jgi:hypothetical protein
MPVRRSSQHLLSLPPQAANVRIASIFNSQVRFDSFKKGGLPLIYFPASLRR